MKHVNRRCRVSTVDGVVAIFVDGAVWMTFDEDDVACKRLAMVQLAQQDVGTHAEIAGAFGLQPLAVDRYRRAYRDQGVTGLLPKSKGPKGPRVTGGRVDKAILKAARAGKTPTAIAAALGLNPQAVRSALRRLDYTPESRQSSLALGESEPPAPSDTQTAPQFAMPMDNPALVDSEDAPGVTGAWQPSDTGASRPSDTVVAKAAAASLPTAVPVATTMDTDPTDRVLDRALAAEGLLEDAAPLFVKGEGLRDVGALLAIPILVKQGVLYEALRVFSGIGPAFYGLRTTVVCLCLMMTLNLSRLQDVMQREPRSLGRLLGLDRSPELKTLRRKLRTLAGQRKSLELMDALARRQLDAPASERMWLYLDGHVSVYSGKHRLREHHVASLRAARPSVMDYWVNQPDGEPLLVVTGAPHEGLVRQVPQTIDKARSLAPGRSMTVIFDREGWSPRLFATIKDTEGVHFLTYRKAMRGERLPRLAASQFTSCTVNASGRKVTYELADTRVRIPYLEGRRRRQVELRQITRLKKDGKQTHVLTDDYTTPAGELAHRMFGRWSQENYFKYAGEHRDLDALVTQDMDPADGTRLVPNPERIEPRAQLARLRAKLREAHEHHGRQALGFEPPNAESAAAHAARVQSIETEILRVQAQYDALAARVPWSTTDKGRNPVQPRVEVRRLMHVFRIVAHRAESALLELLRPHFPDWRHEGRALTRTILHNSGRIAVTASELQITLEPLASPYKTRALAALCHELTQLNSTFPGTNLKMVFDVAPALQSVARAS